MLTLRPRREMQSRDLGWLKATHHFAIGPYGNPQHTPVGALIVLNDDAIAPGKGFPLHQHADVEVITYVRAGAVTHKDSLGNAGRTEAGDVQVMSTGSGIWHSEYNLEPEATRLFQIWLASNVEGGEPRWDNRQFPRQDRAGQFVALASGSGAPGALPIRADAEVLGAMLPAGHSTSVPIPPGRLAYLVAASGRVRVNETPVSALDGLVAQDEGALRVEAVEDSEVVLVVTAPAPVLS